jgi:hypothetical protein
MIFVEIKKLIYLGEKYKMALVKIRMNTWDRGGNRCTKFKRGLAPREGFVEMCNDTKKVILKPGSTKWKGWDITISRKSDNSYIADRKKLYSGLCFKNKTDAQHFMEKHKTELASIAASNPLFDHWSVMNVIKRFEPTDVKIYGKDIKED